jgi:hypothetical protein
MASIISYLGYNFTLTFLVMGLLASIIAIGTHRQIVTRPVIVEALISWFVFFSIGVSDFYNGIAHTVFAEESARFIGWANSPFQQEVGFASFGFALIGFVAFKGSWQTRACAILGSSCFLVGAAGGHVYQMIAAGNYAPGNAGIMFYSDVFLPVFGWVLLYLNRPSANKS